MTTRIDLESGAIRRTDTVAVEEPLEIRLGGEAWTVTMRTPGHDVELAHGMLRSEGVIDTAEDVTTARFCADVDHLNVLDLSIADGVEVDGVVGRRHLPMYGGCGLCGKTSIEAIRAVRPDRRVPETAGAVPAGLLGDLPRRLRRHQQIFDRTGGVHAAGLFTSAGDPLVVREDVGRHNAVDKVLGWALMQGRPCQDLVLTVSSRASFEIVQKAAMAQVPILVCVSAPSSLAIDAAAELGVTLVAFARGRTLVVCSHPERVDEAA